MTFPEDKRGQAWLTAFVGVPFALLWPMGELLTDGIGMRVVFGGLLGLFGAAIGLSLYVVFGHRPIGVRVAVLVTVFLFGLLVALWSRP